MIAITLPFPELRVMDLNVLSVMETTDAVPEVESKRNRLEESVKLDIRQFDNVKFQFASI